jgi:hypothetical protein
MVSAPRAFAAVAALLLFVGCATAPPAAPSKVSDEGVELSAVMASIREALVEAQTHDIASFPALKSITLRLQTTVSRSAGGEVRYLVFSLGSTGSLDTVSTLELEMRPPASRTAETLIPAASLKETLAKAIQTAKLGVLEASKGDPPLVMKSIEIDLKFVVALEGSAGGGVKVLPLGIAVSGQISRQSVHAIHLVFGP